jgi:type VI secretion system protein ImpK
MAPETLTAQLNGKHLEWLCPDLLQIIVSMQQGIDPGEPMRLKKLLKHYLTTFESTARQAKHDTTQISEAQYALTALVDETAFSLAGPVRTAWMISPLSLELFSDAMAGENFFVRLNKLMENPLSNKECIAVYQLCLSYGFKGQYRNESFSVISALCHSISAAIASKKPTHYFLRASGIPDEKKQSTTLNTWILGLSGAIVLLGSITWGICRFANDMHAEEIAARLKSLGF